MSPLSASEIAALCRDGFVIARGILRSSDVEALRRVVDQMAGVSGAGYRSTWCRSDRELAPVRDLLVDPVVAVARSLISASAVYVAEPTQIASTWAPFSVAEARHHIDGARPRPENGVPHTFSLLASVVLSDQLKASTGGLIVWPGLHRSIARFLVERGFGAICECEGSPEVDLGPAVQLASAPGDVILAHYLLAHDIGPHHGEDPRRTIYLRLRAAGHERRWRKALVDPDLEFRGCRALLD